VQELKRDIHGLIAAKTNFHLGKKNNVVNVIEWLIKKNRYFVNVVSVYYV
jgi:hypothetical protein